MTELVVQVRPRWMTLAACHGMDTNLWFEGQMRRTRRKKTAA